MRTEVIIPVYVHDHYGAQEIQESVNRLGVSVKVSEDGVSVVREYHPQEVRDGLD